MRSEAPLASELLLVVALLAPEGCRCAGRLEQASQSRRAGAVLVVEGIVSYLYSLRVIKRMEF